MRLSRNKLKHLILKSLKMEAGWTTAEALLLRLMEEGNYFASVRAVRMALLRYNRQGLIHRRRSKGRYEYLLSSKGARRLEWLQGQQFTDFPKDL